MSSDDWGIVLITAAGIGATLALLLYGFSAPWYRSVVGRARVVESLGMVSLIDLALYIHWSHWFPPRWIPLTIYGVIAVGAWMWLGAVFHEQFWQRRHHR